MIVHLSKVNWSEHKVLCNTLLEALSKCASKALNKGHFLEVLFIFRVFEHVFVTVLNSCDLESKGSIQPVASIAHKILIGFNKFSSHAH